MQAATEYEQVGRVIYRAMRILGRLETLCTVLDDPLGQPSPDERAATTPLTEFDALAPRAVALFTQRYGADAALTLDAIDQMAALRVRYALLEAVLNGTADVGRGDGEFNRLVSCEENLERLHQLVSAA